MDGRDSSNLIIWRSFIAGDKEAFAHIYNLHVDALYRYGTKLCTDDELVKDAIQEIFIDLFLKRHKNTSDPENLRFYLILALKRNLIKKIKRNRRIIGEDKFDNYFEPEYSIEKVMLENETEEELAARLNQALNSLPNRQKEALYLRYNLCMEYEEVAMVLNISVESVRKQVYRALKTIRGEFNIHHKK